jgi:folate-dependent phosphoribosylglycinamide formyltransferase PurN
MGASTMYFVGSGALLYHAANFSLAAGLQVECVCCPPADPAAARLRNRGVDVVESALPNEALRSIVEANADSVVFSINNKHIIEDSLLAGGARFFNVHNGLVQDYRGIAEVCLFAALCRGETRYGATLQQLLPGQKVDAGPAVAQLEFPIGPADRFSEVLQHSLAVCQRLFEMNVAAIASNSHETAAVETAKAPLRYRDVPALCAEADPMCLSRASHLGRYAGFFPRLRSLIDSAQAARSPGPLPARQEYSPT